MFNGNAVNYPNFKEENKMADKIRVSASAANTAARKINGRTEEARNTVNQLQRDVDELKKCWEGVAADAYVRDFENQKREFIKMIEGIGEFSNQLIKITNAILEADRLAGKR
jgi:WXG100 family type VII secretion target